MRNSKDHKLANGFRKIHQSKCAEPECEFFQKPAQQGVCYDRLDDVSTKYIESIRKSAVARMTEVKALRKINKMDTDKKWIRHLENSLECCWMNEDFALDQLVYLRAQVAKLTNRLERNR
jgi:quinolinate synthase